MATPQTQIVIGIVAIMALGLYLIPEPYSAKIIAVLSVVGIVFGAYAFFESARTQQRELILDKTESNNNYFTGVINRFREPEFHDDFYAIYGTTIPPDEFVLLTYITQAIENLNIQYNFFGSGGDPNPTWLNVMRRWVSHPLFPIYWEENKDQYDKETNHLVQVLLANPKVNPNPTPPLNIATNSLH